jgi:DNA-binding LacI/PurR family transcriptional regulator
MATVPAILSEPIRVANLPLPADLEAMLDRHWRECCYTASERAFVEEDFKLNHHYAGHFILATADSPGLQIHAIDLENPDDVDELTERLQAQGYRHVYCLFPRRWNDPLDQIVTLNSES